MKSLYQQIINQPDEFFYVKKVDDPFVKKIRDSIDKSEIFKIDNVANYYWESEQMEWSWDCFPNIAPPFENFYMEYNAPDKFRCVEGIYDNKNFRKFAALFMIIEPQEKNAQYKWEYMAVFFQQYRNKVSMWPCISLFRVGEDGIIYGKKEEMLGVSVIKGEYLSYLDKQKLIDGVFGFLRPFLLAISFLHCRNVKKIIPIHTNSISGRNRHKPRFIFKTLAIEPIKKVLQKEGGSDKNGLKQALHICRGHFKTFNDKPLFGKISGTFWWDSQVRGSISNGITIKDYSVKSPREIMVEVEA